MIQAVGSQVATPLAALDRLFIILQIGDFLGWAALMARRRGWANQSSVKSIVPFSAEDPMPGWMETILMVEVGPVLALSGEGTLL